MCPNCGGNWNNSSNAGVWSLNLNNSRSNSNNNYGFRSDSDSPRTASAEGGAKGGVFLRPATAGAKSAVHPLTGRGRKAFDGWRDAR